METTVGKRLREFREFKQMKQGAFSEATGIRQQTLSTLEADGSVPSYPIIEKLLSAFPDLSSDWLLMGKGEMLLGGRALTPAAQLPPQVPSKLEPLQLPAGPMTTTAEEMRSHMRVVAESAELREVKSERDNLREQNKELLAIVRAFYGGGGVDDDASAAASKKAEGSESAAAKPVEQRNEVHGLIRYASAASSRYAWVDEAVAELRAEPLTVRVARMWKQA